MIVQYQYIETLKRLSDRINYLTDQIEPQAELQQRNKQLISQQNLLLLI